MGAYIMTPADRKAVVERFKEIQDTEVEWNRDPVQIRLSDEQAAALGVTGKWIDQLDGFVEFMEE